MIMGLIATVLCWEMVAINSYVVATHTEWYFQYHLYMSDNDLLLLAGSLLVLLWGCCMSRRMRFLRILTKVPIVATVVHLKYAYDLQLSFASHRAMEIAVTLLICTLIAPMYPSVSKLGRQQTVVECWEGWSEYCRWEDQSEWESTGPAECYAAGLYLACKGEASHYPRNNLIMFVTIAADN